MQQPASSRYPSWSGLRCLRWPRTRRHLRRHPQPLYPPAWSPKDISQLALAAEFAGMQGKNLRMRTVTFAPGARSPEHSHKDRPGMAYVLQGTFTEHRNGVTKEYGPGTSWVEDHNTTHWVENRGSTPAVQLSVVIEAQP